ncbi:hypothetical protein STEG23_004926, partial [Scotinomys teguina]
MTVTPLGWDQDCSLKIREPEVPAPWFLDPGGWSKTAAVSLYFIFPGICTLSLKPCGSLHRFIPRHSILNQVPEECTVGTSLGAAAKTPDKINLYKVSTGQITNPINTKVLLVERCLQLRQECHMTLIHYELLPDACPLTHNFETSRTMRDNDILQKG